MLDGPGASQKAVFGVERSETVDGEPVLMCLFERHRPCGIAGESVRVQKGQPVLKDGTFARRFIHPGRPGGPQGAP